MVQVRTVLPEQMVAPTVVQAVPTVVPAVGHWQEAVLPLATHTCPFMQVVSLPDLKKQPSASFEQVPRVVAVGQKVPSAEHPTAPLAQVQSAVGKVPVQLWRAPQVLVVAESTRHPFTISQVARTVPDMQKVPGPVQAVGGASQVQAAFAPVPVQVR
jgi:hypothetical protein